MASTEVQPAGVVALGKTKVAIIPTIAGAIPTTTELFAGVNISFYIPGGEFPLDVTQNTGQDVRLGSVQVFDVLGQKSYQVPDIQYVADMQTFGAGTPATVLVDGYAGFLVVRYGILATTDWATTQKVDWYPVTLGARWKTKTTTDEFGKFTFTQKVVVSGTATTDVTIAA
jgi:hypothetical protein